MPKRLLIFCVTSSVDVPLVNYHKNARKSTYGGLNNRKTMYLMCLIGVWCGLLQCSGVFAEFPGMRRPPTNWMQSEEKDANSELLARIRAIMMEHNARLKLMQQLEQLTREKEMLERDQSYPIDESNRKSEEIPDVYDYPTNVDAITKDNTFSKMNTQFAYGPQDPRYWMTEPFKPKQFNKAQQPQEMEYDIAEQDQKIFNTQIKQPTEAVPTFNVKAPMIPKPKLQTTKQGTNIDNKTNNKNQQGNQQTEKVSEQQKTQQSVVQKPVQLDDGIGIYVVAMIAGVSAAITVAVIAVGLGWYTLRQKIKAAADMDYPAYGVTGPNKDLLYPSNDKKFAQSVDMYHYQQQKQKKLSLENKSNGETNDGFSDLEGEFDMDDGDYTVYECPGFAPTGEMEVKNPLFADEPITVAQKHQPSSETTEDVTTFVQTTDEKQRRSPNNNKQGKRTPKNISPNKDKTTSKKK